MTTHRITYSSSTATSVEYYQFWLDSGLFDSFLSVLFDRSVRLFLSFSSSISGLTLLSESASFRFSLSFLKAANTQSFLNLGWFVVFRLIWLAVSLLLIVGLFVILFCLNVKCCPWSLYGV